MKKIIALREYFKDHRYGFLALLVFELLTLSFITRLALFIFSFNNVDFNIITYLYIFLVGFLYDVVNASYFIIPFAFYLWLIPYAIYKRKWHRGLLFVLFFIASSILLLNAVSEWFFWDEFGTRFNFIAVDYLIYTTEVIGNIRQSYPLEWIVVALLVLVFFITWYFRSYIKSVSQSADRFRNRKGMLILLILPVLFFYTITTSVHTLNRNRYANDLASNGMYELFAAFRNNTLDYHQFYATEDNDQCYKIVRNLLAASGGTFVSPGGNDITRKIQSDSAEKYLNVVLISVESLSAEYLGVFGNQQHNTANLDSLANNGLLFTNLYATGTRTVRGLEALSLCVPPTPGQSIVRRPDNEQLFTLGNVFKQKGYDTKFIYGGYGYFDNMNNYFSNNNYTVCDRSLLKDDEIHYENIWGVADEDLFTLSLKEIENSVSNDKPFFTHIMTTSNHRPFTYPDGRIDIPSGESREGAVKYTDYAIGDFIKRCSAKEWFNNTLFVIVADHCAASAGKTDLPFNKYHIPLIIYSPANIPSLKMERLMSQVDIGPTLLGMLHFNYSSKFFGYDIFKLPVGEERAFISTYQNLGYIKGNQMVVLSPQQKKEQFTLNFAEGTEVRSALDDKLLKEAIAWYQVSSFAYENGLMRK